VGVPLTIVRAVPCRTCSCLGYLQFRDLKTGGTFLDLYAFGPGAWLALLPDGPFDGTPDAPRHLCFTERGTFNSITAEEPEFHDPKAVKEVLAKYRLRWLPCPRSGTLTGVHSSSGFHLEAVTPP